MTVCQCCVYSLFLLPTKTSVIAGLTIVFNSGCLYVCLSGHLALLSTQESVCVCVCVRVCGCGCVCVWVWVCVCVLLCLITTSSMLNLITPHWLSLSLTGISGAEWAARRVTTNTNKQEGGKRRRESFTPYFSVYLHMKERGEKEKRTE